MIDPRKERYMASDTVHFSCRNWTLEGSSSSTCVRDMNTGDLHWSPEWPACVYRGELTEVLVFIVSFSRSPTVSRF